jgi:hypothetical protein
MYPYSSKEILKVLSSELDPPGPHTVKALYLETNCQRGNENSSRRRDRRHFCLSAFSKVELSFSILFVELPVNSHRSQHRYRHHCAVANIAEEFIVPFPISQRSLLRRCQYRSRVHCAIANIAEKIIALLPYR